MVKPWHAALALSLFLTACDEAPLEAEVAAESAEWGEPWDVAEVLPGEQLAAPNDHTLTTSGEFRQDSEVTFTVSGLPAGLTAYILVSSDGTAPNQGGRCPALLQGTCLDIAGPFESVGSGVVNSAGIATVSITVPNVANGTRYWFQSAVPDGTNAHTSNTIRRTITNDQDEDGFDLCAPGAPYDNANPCDCDDTNELIAPDATEICNGINDDCDLFTDENLSTAWWDARWPYRQAIQVSGASFHTDGAPVALDVDFSGLLGQLGDAAPLDPSSIRVVYHDCSLTEVPSEFVDGIAGFFDGSELADPTGDGFGMVAFRYDRDGSFGTTETLAPFNDPASNFTNETFAIYFASTATNGSIVPSNYNTGLSVASGGSTVTVSNTLMSATFDSTQGGVVSSFSRIGFPSVGAQTSTPFGNGMLIGAPGQGGWLNASADTQASLTVLHAGEMVAIVQASGNVGNAFGAFDYRYQYLAFAGRPEIYARTRFRLTAPSNVGPQRPFWGAAVRPWTVDNSSIATAGSASFGGGGLPDYRWAYGEYRTSSGDAPYGFALGWYDNDATASRPVFSPSTDAVPGRFVGLAGQDITPTFVSGQTSYAGQAGEDILDSSIVVAYPFSGSFGAAVTDFRGVLGGVGTLLQGPPQEN